MRRKYDNHDNDQLYRNPRGWFNAKKALGSSRCRLGREMLLLEEQTLPVRADVRILLTAALNHFCSLSLEEKRQIVEADFRLQDLQAIREQNLDSAIRVGERLFSFVADNSQIGGDERDDRYHIDHANGRIYIPENTYPSEMKQIREAVSLTLTARYGPPESLPQDECEALAEGFTSAMKNVMGGEWGEGKSAA